MEMHGEAREFTKENYLFDEVLTITDVKPYVLRFWMTEFPQIKPYTSDTGQQIFAPKDIRQILLIKRLLFDKKCSIESAKAILRGDLTLEDLPKKTKVVRSANPKAKPVAQAKKLSSVTSTVKSNEEKLSLAKKSLLEAKELISELRNTL